MNAHCYRRRGWTLLAALSAVAAIAVTTPTTAAPTDQVDATENVCPPPNPLMAEALNGMSSTLLTPGAKLDFAAFAASPSAAAAQKEEQRQKKDDWANLCFYHAANAEISARPRVVFMGDSITFNWARAGDAFDPAWVGRGISGQTTPQMLVRFQADVIALRPQVVHIMAGTNDIAGNTGPTTDRDIKNNIRAMTTLAKANGIKVILASIPPAASFPWSPTSMPGLRIKRLNAWIKRFSNQAGVVYVDYHSVLSGGTGGLRPQLGNDGVHPNINGYALMKPLAVLAIRQLNDARLK